MCYNDLMSYLVYRVNVNPRVADHKKHLNLVISGHLFGNGAVSVLLLQLNGHLSLALATLISA